MYLQLTTKCNMACEHCGMNCTHEGEDMSKEVIDAFMNKCAKEVITIGGGEPTLHPLFDYTLLSCLAYMESTFVISNGTNTRAMKYMFTLNKLEHAFGVQLSTDSYHDLSMIDSDVWDMYKESDHMTRDVTEALVNAGRCDFGLSDDCICDSIMIIPNGDVYQCGCAESPKLGNILDEDFNIYDYEEGCYREEN